MPLKLTRRTHEFNPSLFFVIVSAVPAEGAYSPDEILLLTGNAFSREAARALERRLEDQLIGEIRARGDSLTAQ